MTLDNWDATDGSQAWTEHLLAAAVLLKVQEIDEAHQLARAEATLIRPTKPEPVLTVFDSRPSYIQHSSRLVACVIELCDDGTRVLSRFIGEMKELYFFDAIEIDDMPPLPRKRDALMAAHAFCGFKGLMPSRPHVSKSCFLYIAISNPP